MKNFIIGYGETLTSKVKIKSGSGEKAHPYTLEEGKKRFIRGLSNIVQDIETKPSEQCANNEVVVKFIQHPSYLAKSYYPNRLFKMFGMRDVGSRAMKIKPEQWAVKKHPEKGLASCVYVAGTKKQYQNMLISIRDDTLSKAILEQIQTIECIAMFAGSEKIKSISTEGEILKLEVVLHASETEHSIVNDFKEYLNKLGGTSHWEKIKIVGGLTFIPVSIDRGCEVKLAEFSHLRVVRSIPKLRFNKPDFFRNTITTTFSLPEFKIINNDIKVAIFDGGIGFEHLLHQWVTEIIPVGVSCSHPRYLAHGSEVCSTYLFGPFDCEKNKLGEPYTKVDVIRVLSSEDTDPDLFDVLDRIENALDEGNYKYVNLSLGPQIPIDDDDVHVWTSVLDSKLQHGNCMMTVAIGNDGDLEGDLARIQPPSDMVNCFAIGASDSDDDATWSKAGYSCVGPGRSPGLIKPDGVMFGGSENNLFHLYSPLTHSIVGTMGTSYASPYALRIAAGIDAITDLELKPSSVKALMVHNAVKNTHDVNGVGWGKMPNSPEQVIECLEDEAVIIYQGELNQSQHLRVPIPIPEGIDCTWIHLKATFCINTVTDPEHPLHYTRGGLDITFRANDSKFDNQDSEHPKSKSFFSTSNLYPSEEELREDAHKWETCISRTQRFKKNTLVNPAFDVKYHARERGGSAPSGLAPLSYSLIISIRTEGDNSIYNSVLQENQTLQAVKVISRIQV